MDEIDVPQYFLCPISLQIMKDPVTTVTGITYDRQSIQQWLVSSPPPSDMLCPVTKLPLDRNSDLTPNHMLRRLIQAWCIANANNGVDRIPTPKSPIHRSTVLKLIRDVNRNNNVDSNLSRLNALKKLDELATTVDHDDNHERNLRCMADCNVAKAMIRFVLRCFREGRLNLGLEEALRVLQLTWTPENKSLVEDNLDFVQSIMWIMKSEGEEIEISTKTQAVMVMKNISEVARSSLVERLEHDFFEEMVRVLRGDVFPSPAVRSALQVLINTSPAGRNRSKAVNGGAVFAVVEMELNRKPEKRTSELIFALLAKLCSCADGRQQLLSHAGGIAVVAKRLLRVSPAADDRAMCVLETIARFSATREVVAEMLRVGAVSKVCMVMQADCADYLKKKAREILRLHSGAWSNSPCIQVYLLTRNPR